MLTHPATIYLSDIPAYLTGMNYRHMPILSCSRRGLSLYAITDIYRVLLPPVFTLIRRSLPSFKTRVSVVGRLFSVMLSVNTGLVCSPGLLALEVPRRGRSRDLLARLRIHWESGLSSTLILSRSRASYRRSAAVARLPYFLDFNSRFIIPSTTRLAKRVLKV